MRRKVQMLEQQLDGKENERKELAEKYVYYYYLTLFSFSWSSRLPSKTFLIYGLADAYQPASTAHLLNIVLLIHIVFVPINSLSRVRNLELVTEKAERKVKQLEAEKAELERSVEEKDAKYAAVKKELDQTLKELEGL